MTEKTKNWILLNSVNAVFDIAKNRLIILQDNFGYVTGETVDIDDCNEYLLEIIDWEENNILQPYLKKQNILPRNVKDILNTYDENADAYVEANRIVELLESIGWTANWGLSGELFDLTQI